MKKTLYMVIPCFNEEEVLRETAGRLDQKIRALCEDGLVDQDSRVLFVDDGSTDRTWSIISQLHAENPRFSGIRLSRNFGQHNSLFAGMMCAKDHADMIASMDADLQDDIDALDNMVKEYHSGKDIVLGVRSSRKKDKAIRKFASAGFYKVTKLLGIDVVPEHAHFRLMSRRAVEALSKFEETNLFLPYLVTQIGFDTAIVYYERNKRFAGKTKYSLRKLFSMATDGITSFSTKPIALISILASLTFIVFFGSIVTMVVQKLAQGEVAAWLWVFSSVWAVGTLMLVSVRIVGEYVGKAFGETKHRPRYIIADSLPGEHTS